MPDLLWDRPEGDRSPLRTFDSADPWLHFALGWLQAHRGDNQLNIVAEADALVPLELRDLRFDPGHIAMQRWARLLFNRLQDDVTGLVTHPDLDAPVEPPHSHLRTALRVAELLRWFPDDLALEDGRSLVGQCSRWAAGALGPWQGPDAYSGRHRVPPWRYVNKVRVDAHGQRRVFTEQRTPPLKANVVGFLTVALELLSARAPSEAAHPALLTRAANWHMWDLRPPHTGLIPDQIAPDRTSGDGAPDYDGDASLMLDIAGRDEVLRPEVRGHRLCDTDALYWARSLFAAYESGVPSSRPSVHPGLVGPAPFWRPLPIALLRLLDLPWVRPIRDRVLAGSSQRRMASVEARIRLLDTIDVGPDHEGALPPTVNLRMAMGVTLGWLQRGWVDGYGHFSRKISWRDGSWADHGIRGDGVYNTLFVLIEAYRFTGDPFYLAWFRQAWVNLRDISRPRPLLWWPVEWLASLLGRRRPQPLIHQVLQGKRDLGRGLQRNQDLFVQLLVKAYQASDDPWFVDQAAALAETLLRLHPQGASDPDRSGRRLPSFALPSGTRLLHDTSDIAFVRLAIALARRRQVSLRRVDLDGLPEGATVRFHRVTRRSWLFFRVTGLELGHPILVARTRLVVFITEGRYRLVVDDGAPVDLTITGTTSAGNWDASSGTLRLS